VHLLLFFIITN